MLVIGFNENQVLTDFGGITTRGLFVNYIVYFNYQDKRFFLEIIIQLSRRLLSCSWRKTIKCFLRNPKVINDHQKFKWLKQLWQTFLFKFWDSLFFHDLWSRLYFLRLCWNFLGCRSNKYSEASYASFLSDLKLVAFSSKQTTSNWTIISLTNNFITSKKA